MSRIQSIQAREVFDSRGNPTIEAEVSLTGGIVGRAIVPSGASVGSFEAVERRDSDPNRFKGKGVLGAVASVNEEISSHLAGLDVTDQQAIDDELIKLDGTPNKARLGANAILGVSLAVLDAAAIEKQKPLFRHVNELIDSPEMFMPVPLINVLNGGQHADNNVNFQEFMLAPVGGGSFKEALRIGIEVFHELKQLLQSSSPPKSTAVGDEGGFAPDLSGNQEALTLLENAVQSAGFELRKDCYLALDCAATEFLENELYEVEPNTHLTATQLVSHLGELVQKFPSIASIEDGCAEDSWEDWKVLTTNIGEKVQLVGDDLFVTNLERFKKGVERGCGNSILVKLNQIGTVSETLDVIRFAKLHNFTTVISHRSGDTEDTKIADIAVGTGAGLIKTGSVSRSERVAKYNRLLRIEDELQSVTFRGNREFHQFKGN